MQSSKEKGNAPSLCNIFFQTLLTRTGSRDSLVLASDADKKTELVQLYLFYSNLFSLTRADFVTLNNPAVLKREAPTATNQSKPAQHASDPKKKRKETRTKKMNFLFRDILHRSLYLFFEFNFQT